MTKNAKGDSAVVVIDDDDASARRREGAFGLIPIVFITGHGDIAMAVRAMKAGAVDF
jgi:CheY-like chemotaxis protein